MADAPRDLPMGRVAIGLGLQAVLMIAAGVAMWLYSGRDASSFIDLGWRSALQGLAFGGALIAAAATIFRLFPAVLEKTTRMQAKMAMLFTREPNMPMFVWIALCAGIGEEAAFRAGLMTLTADAGGIAAGIVISAAAFALIHLAQPLITAVSLVIGVIVGVVYWWTGSLLTVMIGHAVYDVWALRMLHSELLRLGYFDPESTPAAGATP